jgi:hypothetical protein
MGKPFKQNNKLKPYCSIKLSKIESNNIVFELNNGYLESINLVFELNILI